jgi:hypothetical protein
MRQQQEMAMQNSQMQAQMNQQTAMATAQARMQEEQMKAQLEAQKIQLETQSKAQLLQLEYQLRSEIEKIKGQFSLASQGVSSDAKQSLETQKEDRKDERVKKQAVEQSKLISQRKGERPELEEETSILNLLLNK